MSWIEGNSETRRTSLRQLLQAARSALELRGSGESMVSPSRMMPVELVVAGRMPTAMVHRMEDALLTTVIAMLRMANIGIRLETYLLATRYLLSSPVCLLPHILRMTLTQDVLHLRHPIRASLLVLRHLKSTPTESALTKKRDRHLAIEMTAVVRLQDPEYHQERTSIVACHLNWIGVPHRTWIDALYLIEAVQETRSSQTTRMLIRTSEYRHMVVVKEIIDEKTWTVHDILRADETPEISTNLFATMTARLPHSLRGDGDHETTMSPLDMMTAHRYEDRRGNMMTQHRCGMRIEGGLQAATDRSRPWVQGTTGEGVAVQCEIETGNGSEAEIGGTGGKTLTHIGDEWHASDMFSTCNRIKNLHAIMSRGVDVRVNGFMAFDFSAQAPLA